MILPLVSRHLPKELTCQQGFFTDWLGSTSGTCNSTHGDASNQLVSKRIHHLPSLDHCKGWTMNLGSRDLESTEPKVAPSQKKIPVSTIRSHFKGNLKTLHTASWNANMTNKKQPGGLGYTGDEKLPSSRDYRKPVEWIPTKQPVWWKVRRCFSWLMWGTTAAITSGLMFVSKLLNWIYAKWGQQKHLGCKTVSLSASYHHE